MARDWGRLNDRLSFAGLHVCWALTVFGTAVYVYRKKHGQFVTGTAAWSISAAAGRACQRISCAPVSLATPVRRA